MINITSKVEELLQKSAYQAVNVNVKPLKGKPFELTSLDMEEGSFSIQMDSILRDTLEIGSMTASELKMTLLNPCDAYGFGKYDNVFFAGAKLTVKLLIFDDAANQYIEIPFGVFTIDQQPRMLEKIEITALDNLIRLDIPFQPDQNVYLIRGLVEEGLKKAGLYCADTSMFPNDTAGMIDATKIKSESPITWRQVLMWCCECVGVCGIADENGDIKFGFYKKYTPDVLQDESGEALEVETLEDEDEEDEDEEDEDEEFLLIDGALEGDEFPLTPSIRFADNSELEESDIVITGFQFKDGDQLYPEDAVMDYGLQSEGNLVFSAATPRAKSKFAELANDAVAGFTYRPYSCKIISFPHLQLLDSVNYIKDGKHHHSIITNITFKLNGEMSISAKAKSAVQKGWASLGALTPGQRAIIDAISQKVDKTQAQLSDYETVLLLFNAQMISSLGLFRTTKSDPNGGTIVYFHNLPTLEESKVIYMFGAAGVAWTMDGWNDGSPVWRYGFTDAGDAILNTINAYIVSADLIKTGYLQSQNGASWINMEDGTFCFSAVKDTSLNIDTMEPVYTFEKVLELAGKELNVYGKLRNLNYPNFSASVGPSGANDYGALTITYNGSGYGDIFQVYPTYWYNGDNQDNIVDRGATITSPFVGTGNGNRQSVEFKSSEVMLWSEKSLGSVLLKGGNACVSVFRDNINISTSASHRHCWFNYYQPKYGYSPVAYDFGNGAGGHANIIGNTIYAESAMSAGSAGIVYDGYALSVWGKACANTWAVSSDPALKENITEVADLNALNKISAMKFYSYDYKNQDSSHIDIGTMAPDAPTEIQSNDGKAIDLYSYISLTAKAVQELSAKVEQQEKEIAELKAEIAELKQ